MRLELDPSETETVQRFFYGWLRRWWLQKTGRES